MFWTIFFAIIAALIVFFWVIPGIFPRVWDWLQDVWFEYEDSAPIVLGVIILAIIIFAVWYIETQTLIFLW